MYNITQYTYDKAKQLKLHVVPSKKKNHKIDIFSPSGTFLASVGDSRYKDYPTYLKEDGFAYAENRRRLYKIRHQKDRQIVGSRGWYADQLLW